MAQTDGDAETYRIHGNEENDERPDNLTVCSYSSEKNHRYAEGDEAPGRDLAYMLADWDRRAVCAEKYLHGLPISEKQQHNKCSRHQYRVNGADAGY